jgi:aspartate/methionine/tyrosine aminotransferase
VARFSHRVPDRLRLNRLAEAKARVTEVPFDLTISNPTICGLDYPDTLLAPLGHPRGLVYRPEPRGARRAREAVAATYARWGSVVDPDRIVLTASTSEAYGLIFKLLCNPGDTVAIPTPSYPLFDHLARLESIHTHPVPLDAEDDWRPELDRIAEAPATTRAMVVVHPNNPTGSFIHPDDASPIAGRCRERGLALVADEVFLPFVLDGGPGEDSSFASVDECLTFTLGGLSKSLGLPQLKLAWIAVNGPDELVEASLDRLDYIADAYLSVGTPVSLATPRLLAEATAVGDSISERCRTNLERLRTIAASRPWVTVPRVGGGWSVPIRLPAVLDDEAMALRLLVERGVAVQPGYLFDLPHDSTFVLSLLTPEKAWREGLDLMFDSLASWLDDS